MRLVAVWLIRRLEHMVAIVSAARVINTIPYHFTLVAGAFVPDPRYTPLASAGIHFT